MDKGLKEVIEGFSSLIDDENREVCQKLTECDDVQRALKAAQEGDIEYFNLYAVYPMQSAIAGLAALISPDKDAQFLLKHSEFVETHFEKLIVRHEGNPCCADKSRTIMTRLFSYYLEGKEITFDYEQEYTYHLPRTVFKTHNEIKSFYEGLRDLYYGCPEKYLIALNSTTEKAKLCPKT